MKTIQPDLILMWPTHLDYPGFRIQLLRDRKYFNRIIIGWNNCSCDPVAAQEIIPFLEGEMSESKIDFVSQFEVGAYPSPCWVTRNIGACLRRVTSDWILIL